MTAMRHAGTGLGVFAALALSAAVGASAVATAANDPPAEQVPGTRIQVLAEGLPPPYATPSANNASRRVLRPDNPPFRLPPGFSVAIFADHLTNPRSLLVLPDGDVLLAQSKTGEITLLRDSDGDGVAEFRSTFASGFARPYGLALSGGQLYVADTVAVWQMPYGDGDQQARAAARPITSRGALGGDLGHWTRNLVFSPDGSRFYVAIGSQTNVGEDPSPRGSVQSFTADGQGQQTYASGLRNPVGMAFYPGTNDLYAVVNERDGLGDGLVPDFLTRLSPGASYGWPYAYIGQHPQPGLAAPPGFIDKAVVPDLLFRPHSAPLGLVFYEGDQFPAQYRGDAFVALHGSWNSARPTGYMVARVPFANGRPKGYYEPFLTGFWLGGYETAFVFGRPAGLAVAKDGSLLVADDGGNVVWRVSYAAP
jgi:glucose/arabinose dehydrogenase